MSCSALAFARGTTDSVREDTDLADLAASEVAERQARGHGVEIVAMLRDAPCRGDPHAFAA